MGKVLFAAVGLLSFASAWAQHGSSAQNMALLGHEELQGRSAYQPLVRENHTAVYDGARDRMVVFGGYDASLPTPQLNDTWALSLAGSGSWSQIIANGVGTYVGRAQLPEEFFFRYRRHNPSNDAIVSFTRVSNCERVASAERGDTPRTRVSAV